MLRSAEKAASSPGEIQECEDGFLIVQAEKGPLNILFNVSLKFDKIHPAYSEGPKGG